MDEISYQEKNYECIQKKIGYLPQEIELYPSLTVQECLEYMGDLAATCSRLAVMKKGHFLFAGSVQELLDRARGCVWECVVKDSAAAQELEGQYILSAKQYVEDGIQMRILSREKPAADCRQARVTLEDAYIYSCELQAR